MVKRAIPFLKSALFAVIVIAATAYIVNDVMGTKIQRLFYGDVDLLHDGDVAGLTHLGGFGRYQAVCAFSPNAMDYSKISGADFRKMLGSIDYSAWQDDIMNNFADGFSHGPVFYMIKDNAVVNALPSSSPYFSFVGLYFQQDPSFAIGCLPANAICVQKATIGGAQTVLLARCLQP